MNRRLSTQDVLCAVALRFPVHPINGLSGTSLKPEHLSAILDGPKLRGFFEVHAENYMGAGGPPHCALNAIRRDYPVSLYGVCMSIGACACRSAVRICWTRRIGWLAQFSFLLKT